MRLSCSYVSDVCDADVYVHDVRVYDPCRVSGVSASGLPHVCVFPAFLFLINTHRFPMLAFLTPPINGASILSPAWKTSPRLQQKRAMYIMNTELRF